ncbi:GNAT family N-acetyltransferase [Marinomonas sp. C2222]|uniref:GNAT family N-acetyltransferase n=1 Tax=Marinomonas sargassi TaxID=2984494 RepID=A0ABT2YU44_9GAMM|nr:GNAT family N-acetyltransferase [Marinomonas sargassi]MCV2403410.1 GNAT family N-acetyltransferase [Marinomonas sargassi]
MYFKENVLTMDITLRPALDTDIEFAFEAKRQAMGTHIEFKWGWDEVFQRSLHQQRYSEKPWFIIMLDGEPIGTLSIHKLPEHTRFGEFYLLSKYQNKGIGSQVLSAFLEECDKYSKTVILEYLKWNPVGSLYKRYGFRVTSENDIHYFMERSPQQK